MTAHFSGLVPALQCNGRVYLVLSTRTSPLSERLHPSVRISTICMMESSCWILDELYSFFKWSVDWPARDKLGVRAENDLRSHWLIEWLLLIAISAMLQLYHGQTKLLFNEMKMRSALYIDQHTSSLKQQSTDRHSDSESTSLFSFSLALRS